MNNSILTTGFQGLVGTRFVEMFSHKYEVRDLSRRTGVDISESEQVMSALENEEAQIIVHMAAKTDVDSCEDDKILGEEGEAWKINVTGTENIVEAAKKYSKRVIYISTDFVFDGTKETYTEDDEVNPVNWYGETKAQGEVILRESGVPYTILRISYPYRKEYVKKTDFVRKIKELILSGREIKGITDHVITPTFIDDIASGIDLFTQKEIEGVFHLVGSSSHTIYDAIKMIGKSIGREPNLVPTTRKDYFKDKAYRPFKLILKNDRISDLGLEMSSFEDGLGKISN